MPEDHGPRDQSLSGEFEDSDQESQQGQDDFNPPGRPGRKKNPNSQAARRDQNRIAQREFRLRKQQRIRDLEARVEILSGGTDEALGEMRNILKDLMSENQALRGLLRSLAGFIGEGAGGLLPKLGWELSEFNQFINRSETDTAWEGYQRRKKVAESVTQGQKRPAEDDSLDVRSKKARNGDILADHNQNFSLFPPMTTPPLSSNGIYPTSRSSDPVGNVPSQPYVGSGLSSYQAPYLPGVSIRMESTLSPLSYSTSLTPVSVSQRIPSQQLSQASEEILDDNEPTKAEAHKLIQYHLDNYKRNNQYCLPASLRLSQIQKTIPHEGTIDFVLHPELRDRMITLRSQYSLVDCMFDYKRAVTIHGDDVLAHANWEISEEFLRRYPILIDKSTLAISNRWRKERGEPELRLGNIGVSD